MISRTDPVILRQLCQGRESTFSVWISVSLEQLIKQLKEFGV